MRGTTMAGRGPQSYLKRQKEQQRAARALAKRTEKQARRETRRAGGNASDSLEDLGITGEAEQASVAGDEATE